MDNLKFLAKAHSASKSNTLFLSNIPNSVGDSFIRDLCAAMGEVTLVELAPPSIFPLTTPVEPLATNADAMEIEENDEDSKGGANTNGKAVEPSEEGVLAVRPRHAGFGMVEFKEKSVLEDVLVTLDEVELKGQHLGVKLAGEATAVDVGAMDLSKLGLTPTGSEEPTMVVLLENMLEADELLDDEEFDDIYQDVREKLGSYGQVMELLIPRPESADQKREDWPRGVGKAVVRFASPFESKRCSEEVGGREFSGRRVLVSYLTEDAFTMKEF